MAVYPSEHFGTETDGKSEHDHAAQTGHPKMPIFMDEHGGAEEYNHREHHVGFVKQISDHERASP